MHHSELRPKGEAIRAEIDEFVIHVITGWKVHHKRRSDDGLDINLGPVSSEFLTL